MNKIGIILRDEKGRFIKGSNIGHPLYGGFNTGFKKGHKFFKGAEKGWFKKGMKSFNYKNGIWSYRKYKKSNCEDCSGKKDLQVHHLDKDRTNNNQNNLRTLCRTCHWKYHLGKRAWNKGLRTGSLSEEHRRKIGQGVRRFYAN